LSEAAAGSLDDTLVAQVLAGDRRALAKSITLLESTRAADRARGDALLGAILPHSGYAIRVGISGVPGVGKSTLIETLGLQLIAQGHKVAVLAVDPSSTLSGGSILGDKTRMERLSAEAAAFIRPSPSSGTLGGVAEKTREAMLVCEAAGFDVVLVETVGVGQSESAVSGMTDLFLLLQLPNAGDDLQAIKRGVMELADLVVVNKSDLDPAAAARAIAQIDSGLRKPLPVFAASALHGQGFERIWVEVQRLVTERRESGEFEARRRTQALAWMWDIVHARLMAGFHEHPGVQAALPAMLREVGEGRLPAGAAARRLLQEYDRRGER